MGTIIGPWESTATLEDNDSDARLIVRADASGATIEIREHGEGHEITLDSRGRRALILVLNGIVDYGSERA